MTLYQMIEKYYDPYFKALGYHKTGVCEFSRLNDSKNIQKVEIQKDKYSKKYRISLSVWPTYLYDQCELGFLAIMNLDCLVNGVRKGEQWKSYENEGVANESFQKAAQEFEKYSQTWFDKYKAKPARKSVPSTPLPKSTKMTKSIRRTQKHTAGWTPENVLIIFPKKNLPNGAKLPGKSVSCVKMGKLVLTSFRLG